MPDTVPNQLSSLPYFREYLDTVLRPRVERALTEVRAQLSESVLTEVVRIISEEQSGDVPDDAVRTLLEQTLGLQIRVEAVAVFANEPDERAEMNVADESNDGSVERVEVRRRGGPGGRPLINAVLRGDAGSR